ncbi:MAG: hypothetical protein WA126_07305 [Thermodesulfovibrionales bacterium]
MRKLTSIGVFLFIIIFSKYALSWDDRVTHKDLSRYAAENSTLSKDKGDYLRNIGFNKGLNKDELVWNGGKRSIKEWLASGAELEDSPLSRSFNHFHNPLRLWNQAGLDDWFVFHLTGKSSLLWSQDGSYQQSSVNENWSLQKTREYFYTSLTSMNDLLRQENFARTFMGLGHQMHLLQDTAVPDHVRNDAHPEDAIFGKVNINIYFESWAKSEQQRIIDLASDPNLFISPNVSFNISYNGLAPTTQLFDTDQYNGTNPSVSLSQGLAEYTNANFFSGDTIFAAERYSADHRHYSPYPKRASTDLQNYLAGSKHGETVVAEDGDTDTVIWISKNADGENVSHFVKTGKLSKWYYNIFGEGELFYNTFYRDEKCHEDYAQKLIPRAVGYSAGLLDYFFRGNIEISLPDSGVYAQIDDPAQANNGFTQIKLLVKNITPNYEQMTDGSIELVVKYRLAIDDPFQNYPEDHPFQAEPEFSYIVVPEANGVRSIPRDNPVELIFDLSNNFIPLYAIDVYLHLVYRGNLGSEADAVAIGSKDISEPTPVDYINDADLICMDGSMYTAGSQAAIDLVDKGATGNQNGIADEWDVYAHDIKDIYTAFSPEGATRYASPDNYNIYTQYINAGEFLRTSFILTDYRHNYNLYETWVRKDPQDPWIPYSAASEIYHGKAIKNQTDYVEDIAVCAPFSAPCHIWWYPSFLSYRGHETWWGEGVMFINEAYPINSECSCYEGILSTCPVQQLSESRASSQSFASTESAHADKNSGKIYLRRSEQNKEYKKRVGIKGLNPHRR